MAIQQDTIGYLVKMAGAAFVEIAQALPQFSIRHSLDIFVTSPLLEKSADEDGPLNVRRPATSGIITCYTVVIYSYIIKGEIHTYIPMWPRLSGIKSNQEV